MWVLAQVHKPALHESTFAPLRIPAMNHAQQNALSHVEFLAVAENFKITQVEPLSTFDAKVQRQPGRNICKILVPAHFVSNFGLQPVANSHHKGPWVMSTIGFSFRIHSPSAETAAAKRAEHFPQALLLGSNPS